MTFHWMRSLAPTQATVEDIAGPQINLSVALRKLADTTPSLTIRKSAGEKTDAAIIKRLESGFDATGLASEISTLRDEVFLACQVVRFS
jgi:hypothetical protein